MTTTNGKLGLQFTERMTGYFLRDPAIDFEALAATDPKAANHFEFTMTIRSEDLDEMLTNRLHQGSISGTVTSAVLSSQPVAITDGIFNLFVENPRDVETRSMRYELRFADANGKQFLLVGNKIIRNEPLLHVWHDTSTLFITLQDGSDAAAPVLGRGILHIEPADFLKHMTTLRVTNAQSHTEELSAIARFGSFFAGQLSTSLLKPRRKTSRRVSKFPRRNSCSQPRRNLLAEIRILTARSQMFKMTSSATSQSCGPD